MKSIEDRRSKLRQIPEENFTKIGRVDPAFMLKRIFKLQKITSGLDKILFKKRFLQEKIEKK